MAEPFPVEEIEFWFLLERNQKCRRQEMNNTDQIHISKTKKFLEKVC